MSALDPDDPPELEAPRLEIALGLLDPKHRRALGPAWHLYFNLLRRKPFGSPWVFGGRVLSVALLALIEEVSSREIQRWLARLERHGYIRVERGRAGLRIRILKAKEWRKGRMRIHKDPPARFSGQG